MHPQLFAKGAFLYTTHSENETHSYSLNGMCNCTWKLRSTAQIC
jgi:hypothetical protein